MIESAFMLTRLLTILFFSFSAGILFYAAKNRARTYHLVGIAIWCIHVVLFTTVVLLYSAGIVTIIRVEGLNLWSATVRLHGGIMCFVTALHYVSKKELLR
jgi:hypothetical protein